MARVSSGVQLGWRDHAIAVLVKPVKPGPFHGQEFGAGDPLVVISIGTAQARIAPATTSATTAPFGAITAVTAFGLIAAFTAMSTAHGASLLAVWLVSGLIGTGLMHGTHPLANRRLVGRIEIAIAIAILPLEHLGLKGIDFSACDRAVAIGIGQVQHHHAATLSAAMPAGTVMTATTGLGLRNGTGDKHGRSGQHHCEKWFFHRGNPVCQRPRIPLQRRPAANPSRLFQRVSR